jgi:UDP-3-O-[3-hydroxymyristoyl] N-acetylglucosamine deacetylase
MYQTTIEKQASFSGIGLHTGKFINVKITPAYADTGIQFRRSDKNGTEHIKASPFNVYSTHLATTIKCGDYSISTIEHLMSALYGLGIDNAFIDVDGSEIPILDGSAAPVTEILKNAGIKKLKKPRKYLKFKKKIRIEKDGKWIELIPSRYFKTTFHISFDNEVIKEQKAYFKVTPEIFYNEISKARTFGFKKDVEAIWQMGLAKGGSLENAVVIDNDKILNPGGLRYDDEFVRHKILDLIGDLALIGHRFYGHVRASKSGHQLNNLFAKALLESTNCYSVIEFSEEENLSSSTSDLVLEPHGI